MRERKLSNVRHGNCSESSGFELKAMVTINSPSHQCKVLVSSEALRCGSVKSLISMFSINTELFESLHVVTVWFVIFFVAPSYCICIEY